MTPAAEVTGQSDGKATRPLEALNFFMADVQAGIGPFLGVFLQARGWGTDLIGTVMTIGGVAGMLATSPAGALVDATRHKRAVIFVAGVMTRGPNLTISIARRLSMFGEASPLPIVGFEDLGERARRKQLSLAYYRFEKEQLVLRLR